MLLTKNQIIENLFVGKNFNDCIEKMDPPHLRDDLKMEVIGIVCEWPEDKVVKLFEDKVLDFVVVRVILNQIQSNSSPFFYKYRQPFEDFSEYGAETFGSGNARNKHTSRIGAYVDKTNEDTADDVAERLLREELEDFTIAEIDNLYWYDSEMIKLYLKHGTFRAIQEHVGIPYISCYKNIQKSLAILRKKVLGATSVPVLSKKELAFIQNNKP